MRFRQTFAKPHRAGTPSENPLRRTPASSVIIIAVGDAITAAAKETHTSAISLLY
jgi:hypothetical protein